jgi:chromosome segregation ATPase
MARRSTIGENPLDFLVSENPLDTVVPGPEAASRATKMEERLERIEAGIGELQAEMAGFKNLASESNRVKAEMAQLQSELARMKGELGRLTIALPQLQAELAPLKTEVTELKADLAQLRSKLTPSDLPWWMGKKK